MNTTAQVTAAGAPSKVERADSRLIRVQKATCGIYEAVTSRLAEGLLLKRRQYRGLNAQRALAELDDARESARRTLEAVTEAAGMGKSTFVGSPGPDAQGLTIYEEHLARAHTIPTSNRRKTGEPAQPARRGAAWEMCEATRRVREVYEGDAQRLAAEAALVAPGSDHYLRAHAFVPFSETGWINRHLGFRIERRPSAAELSWREAVIRLVECIPESAHRPGPGRYDPAPAGTTP
jgi:hypothetical protein